MMRDGILLARLPVHMYRKGFPHLEVTLNGEPEVDPQIGMPPGATMIPSDSNRFRASPEPGPGATGTKVAGAPHGPGGRPSGLRGRNRPGFTFIEILTVVLVISILMSFLVAGARWAMNWSMLSRARGEMQEIAGNLAEGRSQTGVFEASHAFGFGTSELAGDRISGQVGFLSRETSQIDPWGNRYLILTIPDPVTGQTGIRIHSWGPDGESGTSDDLYLDVN